MSTVIGDIVHETGRIVEIRFFAILRLAVLMVRLPVTVFLLGHVCGFAVINEKEFA